MGVMDTRDKVSCLLCFVSLLSLLLAQELEFFNKDTTIDFKKHKVLAEIGASTDASTPEDYKFTVDDISSSDYHTTAEQGASTVLTDTDDQDTARLGRLMDTSDSKVHESTSTKAARDSETIRWTTKSSHRTVEMGSSLKDFDHFSIETPPNIVHPPTQERVIVSESDRPFKIVQCLAKGKPQPTFEWLRNGAPIGDSQNIKSYDNGSLIFIDFSNREEGLYQCFATNKLGTSVSVMVPIVNERLPAAVHSENLNKTHEGTEGDPMTFECASTPLTVPEYTRRWYYKVGSGQLLMSNRIGTDSKGVLRFAYLEPSDAKAYSCALVPDVAAAVSSIMFYDTVVLNVKQRTKYPSRPILAYTSPKIKAMLGGTATLECFFTGYPIATITWKKSGSGEIITGSERMDVADFGRKLVLFNVQEEDADSYICTASNGHGTEFVAIAVNVTSPPQKLPNQGINTLIKPDGRDQVLMCNGKVVHPQFMSIPQWYRNGKPFNESNLPFPDRYSFNKNMTELTIRSLDKEQDTACFQCKIFNSEGYLFYDGFLRVIKSIKIDKRPLKHLVINNASSVDISVHASGDSCCALVKRWYLNGALLGKEILQAPPYQWGDDGNSLKLVPSTVDYEKLKSSVGDYTCRVNNDHEVLDVNFTISLNGTQSNPEQLLTNEAAMSLWWTGILCGILLIIIAIIVIVIFVKRTYPGDTYQLEKQEIKHHLNPEKDLLDQSFQEV